MTLELCTLPGILKNFLTYRLDDYFDILKFYEPIEMKHGPKFFKLQSCIDRRPASNFKLFVAIMISFIQSLITTKNQNSVLDQHPKLAAVQNHIHINSIEIRKPPWRHRPRVPASISCESRFVILKNSTYIDK